MPDANTQIALLTLARLKPDLAENLAIGRGLGFDDISRATRTRASIHRRVQVFFETYDLLLTPATIVPPFPVEERFVQSCDGQVFRPIRIGLPLPMR